MPSSDSSAAGRTELHKLYDTLSKVDFLGPIKVHEMDSLVSAMRKRRLPAGSLLFKQGDEGDAFYLVASGILDVTVRRGFLSHKVGRLQEGDYVGEGALLSDGPRAATVSAVTDCELYVLYERDFKDILMKNPAIAAALRAHQAQSRERRKRA